MIPIKENQIKVAVASDFLTGFSKIPRKQQGKVLEFVNKFRSDPMSPGINYEKIHPLFMFNVNHMCPLQSTNH